MTTLLFTLNKENFYSGALIICIYINIMAITSHNTLGAFNTDEIRA